MLKSTLYEMCEKGWRRVLYYHYLDIDLGRRHGFVGVNQSKSTSANDVRCLYGNFEKHIP